MTGITRRRLLALAAGAAFVTAIRPFDSFAQDAHEHMGNGAASSSPAPAGRPLPLPPLVEPDASGVVKLKVQTGRHSFEDGSEAESAGVNGTYLGPLVRLKNGETVTLSVENGMDEETTLHWHGLFVPSVLDGGPHNVIAPGAEWKPKITVNQPASFNWFHPHLHGNTARQAHLGIAGLMVVTDGKDAVRGLPEDYGIDDFPLVFQDRRVIEGSNVYQPDIMDLMHGFRGDRLIVNGTVSPEARVPASVVRLRILNGANARNFHIRLSNNQPLLVIASDGGFIEKPEPVERLSISPGERYEVLVDFSKVDAVDLLTYGNDSGGGDLHLMRFVVDNALQAKIRAFPDRLDGPGAPDEKLSVRRRSFFFDERMAENMKLMMTEPSADPHAGHNMGNMDMSATQSGAMDHDMHGARSSSDAGPALQALSSGVKMAIAGKPFDMDRIDVEVRLGSWEIWELTTKEMPHPFHIHGASFRILSMNGKAPPAHQSGWKDTALIDGKAEILVHFDREAIKSHPFMFHCHVLEHEDVGMMAQFITI
ncbi:MULTISPECIES: multicopper oxidase CueO [unclassified Ochrobactrum]|uniref:multicopper oxidase CueO n=1 Tax=unclassified Ochrobactrum TaxID=239106 RepID=UPI000DEEED56|nr:MULTISPECIES: multicopper oxidase CueO [unclassified Ochrobactrum]MBQ0707614.1 multicopper oxidase CueO [Ochrobactrum sp. AP1BH01-1]